MSTIQFVKERSPTLTRGMIYVVLAAAVSFRDDLRELARLGTVDAFSWLDAFIGFIIAAATALAPYLDNTHHQWKEERKKTETEFLRSQIAAGQREREQR